ncbi:hypothetical protein [Acidihalobacter prosperus]
MTAPRRTGRRFPLHGVQRKALAVYSADCIPSWRLKTENLARLANKLAKAVLRYCKTCCTGTLLTSLTQTCYGDFISDASEEEVM